MEAGKYKEITSLEPPEVREGCQLLDVSVVKLLSDF